MQDASYEAAKQAFERSIKKLGVDCFDLGHSEIINHFDPAVVKMISGLNVHD